MLNRDYGQYPEPIVNVFFSREAIERSINPRMPDGCFGLVRDAGYVALFDARSGKFIGVLAPEERQ